MIRLNVIIGAFENCRHRLPDQGVDPALARLRLRHFGHPSTTKPSITIDAERLVRAERVTMGYWFIAGDRRRSTPSSRCWSGGATCGL
jgi:hypothetical protein